MEPTPALGAGQFAVVCAAAAVWAVTGACTGEGRPRGPVRPGVEVLLADSFHLVEGRAVGLITNPAGVDSRGRSTADRLAGAGSAELVALFSPEHGIRARARDGERVAGGVDPVTGLPVRSLYGETRKPTPEMLRDVEVLLFDLQDVGTRYYTYVSTMALAMGAAGEAKIPFVVLDRPNPIGGTRVEGNVLDPAYATFVGLYPVPMRHGMTAGELARLIRGEFGVEVELHVVPAAGWRRGMWFDETGLPWVPPSPGMQSLDVATVYPGSCLFEGTNLSVGRGTDAPFLQVGAPWLDGERLADTLNGYALDGVRFEPVRFVPTDPGDGKFAGDTLRGVRFRVTDREAFWPVPGAVAALLEARRIAADRWAWNREHFDRLAGTDRLRRMIESGAPLSQIVAPWAGQIEDFRELRRPYLIYE